MATFAFNTMALARGTTFVFGSWVCVANGSGGFDSHLSNPREPEAISSGSCNFAAESSNLGEMLLSDLINEIEQNLDTNSSSTWTQIGLTPCSTQDGTLYTQPTFGLRNSSSTYQQMIKSSYSTYRASLDYPSYIKKFSRHRQPGATRFFTYTQI